MARPERNNVDYFPHPTINGRKMYYIKQKYGHEGYSIWYQILEQLGEADYHYLDLSEDSQMMFTSSQLMTTETKLMEVLSDIAKLNGINQELWSSHKVVYSEKFVSEIKDAYSKRKNKCIDLSSLCTRLSIKLLTKPSNEPKSKGNKPQSIGKERKGKKSKPINPLYRHVSEHLKKRVLETRQQKITETNLKDWSDCVRLMVERDNRTLDQIDKLIDECHDMEPRGSNGFTWRNNILSMSKLRDRWNEGKIFIGMNKKTEVKNGYPRPGSSWTKNENS